MIIPLISDTVTKPTPGMLDAMMRAEVGDDVFGQDPSINVLQNYMAELFGMEAALFCPSGTMSNQLAIKCHTQPMDELICDINSHVYQYENGGYAFHSGLSLILLQGDNGKVTASQIESVIRPDLDWLPNSKLVVLENSANRAGGNFYTLDEIAPITALCKLKGLKLHLDGARLFNVLVETGESPADVGKHFDSISICLSKGLGAPAGTVLLGDHAFIKKARKWRKAMGGGMRQAGFLAAAGLYALQHQVDRLKEDNQKAKRIGAILSSCDYVTQVRPVKTNIVIFDVVPETTADKVLAYYKTHGLIASSFASHTIRFVFHLDISDDMEEVIADIIQNYKL
jgi:threonine aldolase